MIEVKGYKTIDGMFFEKEEDALKHEAEIELKDLAGKIAEEIYYYGINAHEISVALLENIDMVEILIDSYKKIKK